MTRRTDLFHKFLDNFPNFKPLVLNYAKNGKDSIIIETKQGKKFIFKETKDGIELHPL